MSPIPNLKALNKLVGQHRSASYSITFKLANGFTTDGSGNRVPAAVTDLVVPCRLRPVTGNAEKVQRESVPGVDSTSIMLNGWCNDETNNGLFPDSIRRQGVATGQVTYNGQAGRIQCRIAGVTAGSASVGERFKASFTPD